MTKATKAEREYYAKVAEHGCYIANRDCGGRLELHHPTGAGMALKSKNSDVIPLCFNHHSAQTPLKFGQSVHKGTATFEANFGTQAEMVRDIKQLMGVFDDEQ